MFGFFCAWTLGMGICLWADLPRFVNQTDNEILADCLKWTDRKYGRELKDSGYLNRKNPTRTESLFVLIRRHIGRKKQDRALENMADFASCVHSYFELNQKKLSTKVGIGITDNIYKKHFRKRIKKRNFDIYDGANNHKGKDGDAQEYPFYRDEDFENLEEKTVIEKLIPIMRFFFDTLMTNHQVINLLRESARMFPKHSKFNMLALALIQLSFMSCLFYQSGDSMGCGDPEKGIAERIAESIVNVCMAIIFTVPVLTFAGKNLRVPEIYRKQVKKAPISLKVTLWKSFEPSINTRFMMGYCFSGFIYFLYGFFIINFGENSSNEANIKLLLSINMSYAYDTFVSEIVNTGFTTVLEVLRRLATGDTKKLLNNIMILRLIAKELKNMG